MDKEKLLGFTEAELATLKKLAETSTVKPFGDPLPKDFDGIFRFTNYTNEEFTTRWNNKEYTFPANSTTPITIYDATPLEIQNIRKKFARDLAVKVFYGTDKFKKMNTPAEGKKPPTYTDEELTPYIQQCLEPLPAGRAIVKEIKRKEKAPRLDDEGNPIVTIISDKTSLVGKGTVLSD